LTSKTKDFTNCFDNNLSFEEQTKRWRNVLEMFVKQSFKKIRITNKQKKKTSELNDLMEKRRTLKKKDILEDPEEEELINIEMNIASICEESNRKKVNDNFKTLGGNDGDLLHPRNLEDKKEIFS
jgi:hypothetical protein